jgi:HK97 family phage major capsid protein
MAVKVTLKRAPLINRWEVALHLLGLIQPMQVPGIIMPGLRRLTIRDLLAQGRISSNSLEYVRENVFTNNAASVAEKALKPESDITFSKQTANVKTIAHWIQASRQVMDDAPMLESYVNNRLLYGLALEEERQLLNGDGSGDDLEVSTMLQRRMIRL